MRASTVLRRDIKRRPAVPMQPVVDPAGWTADEIACTGEATHYLSDNHIAELDMAIAAAREQGLDILDITKERFPVPLLGQLLRDIRHGLLEGCGFALIRGFPVARLWLTTDGARPLVPEYAERINGIVVPGSRLTAPLEAE